jgi:hypothetical protein
VSTRSSQNGKKNGKHGSDHLQIRSLWTQDGPQAADQARAGSAARLAPGRGALAVVPAQPRAASSSTPAIGDWPIGLPGVRPGVAYTRGVPSPRVAGQQWEDQFRTKLVAAIAQRRRRAYISVGVAGGGVLILVACFAALLAVQGAETAGNDRAHPASLQLAGEPASDAAGSVRLAMTLDAATTAAPARRKPHQHPFESAQGPAHIDLAAIDLAANDQEAPASLVPAGARMPARIVSNHMGEASARPAAAAAPVPLRTRLRIIGDTIGEPGAMILLRGLPEGVLLSDGMSPSQGTWVLGLQSARDLQIISPAGYHGTFRASLEVIGPGGVALLRQDAEMTVPAAALVIVLPEVPATAAPAPAHVNRTPRLQAWDGAASVRPAAGAMTAGDGTPAVVSGKAPGRTHDKALGTALGSQIASEDQGPPASQPAAPGTRRTAGPPAYGLGGPR